MKSFRSKYLSILSAVVGIMTFVFSVNAEEWKLHPSFDRTPLRIIDTPEDTYFLVHQQIYDKSKVGYDFPSLTLFRYNKNATDKGITPLVHDVQLTSADIRMADYSPKGEYLIIVYNDGGIDLIDKDKHLTHIDKLKRYTIPGMAKVASVSFEPSTGDAWIGTDAGYMHVDAVSFTIQDVKVFDRGIDRICKFGDKLVALSGNAAWQSDVVNPLTFNEFKKISSVGSPSIMLPLGENEFAYVYGAPGVTRALMLAKFDGTNWSVSNLGSDNFYSISANEATVNRYEANFIPNRDGYLLYSTSKAWQIYAPKNGESTRLVSISLDSNPVSLGSWDFSDFWCYRDRGTFVPRHVDFTMDSNATSAAATWTDMQDPIRPNAPAAFICTYMDYSPKYGMLVMNHGQEWHFRNDSPMNPSLLSGCINNSWNVYSHAFVTPASVDSNDELRSIYNKYINRFPIHDPHGIIVDPINNDWIVSGSMFGGLMLQDMSDIKKNVIKFAAENDLFLDFPGVIPATPQKSWGTLSCFSPASIDNDGTIWAVYVNAFTTNRLQLKYLLASDREFLYKTNSLSKLSPSILKTIDFPYTESVMWCCKGLALRHKDNANKVLVCPNTSTSPIIVFDHKGTLDDTSDDSFIQISGVINRFGDQSSFVATSDIVEDPTSGNILLAATSTLFVFNLNSSVTHEYIYGDVINFLDVLQKENFPEACQINKVIFDENGNMWVGTDTHGVIGISKDMKTVIGKYNMSNSSLPSNTIYGLLWNPVNKSLMISTKVGLAEVFPDINTSSDRVSFPRLNISKVLPDYSGNIEIRNLMPQQCIVIKNNAGMEINRILNSNSKVIEWDLKDKNGKRIPSGTYFIQIDNNLLELVVMSEYK